MELNQKTYELKFTGSGGQLFSVLIVNWILTTLTLGLYYPWAKANYLKFMYQSTTLDNDGFDFKGTGREMFIGFIKAVAIFIILGLILFSFLRMHMVVLGVVIFYVCLFAIIPLIIHGSCRYRLSRSSWRGIRFRYDGNRNTLTVNFFKGFFLTIITFGIYGSWFAMNMRNYIIGKMKLGNLEFKYHGKGVDYFLMNLKGYFLSLITLGIYSFWWMRDIFAYYVDNMSAEHEGKTISFRSTVSAGDIFKIIVVNYLMLIFTLGIAYAWIVARTMRFVMDHIEIKGDINFDELKQQADSYGDATADDAGDLLDIDFIF